MRIEILVDNEEPKIYPLDRPKIVVGSHESCDIIINHTSISRKHLVIVVKDEKFFVADQGSMNGSYINEHRLVPGSSTEFTSFFPVRLGDNVLVSLLSDEDASELGPESALNTQDFSGQRSNDESTKMISVKDLQKSNTSDLVKKRTETVAKRKTTVKKAAVKKKPQNSNSVFIFIALILIGAAYYQFIIKNDTNVENGESKVKAVETPTAVVEVEDTSPIIRVNEGEYPNAETILTNFKNPKCSTDVEKYLCSALPLIFQGKGGTVLIDKNVVVMVDVAKYLPTARSYLKAAPTIEGGATTEAIDTYNLDLGVVLLMLWIREMVPLEIKFPNEIKGQILTIAFIEDGETPTLISAASIYPDTLIRLRKKAKEQHFIDAKKNGALEFAYVHEYLRFL